MATKTIKRAQIMEVTEMVELKEKQQLVARNLFEQSFKLKKIPFDKIRTIEALAGDASTRSYYRVQTVKASYVICLNQENCSENQKREFLEIQKVLEKRGR